LKRRLILATHAQAEQEIEKVNKYGEQLLHSCDDSFPKTLLEIHDHPPVITVLGNQDLINNNQIVAIVGTRNASSNGFKFASTLATALGQAGVIIASGMAKGIDFAAHSGSIKT